MTKRVNALRDMPGEPVWQRNYYEHIIRTEEELEKIRYYIGINPEKWERDRYNPSAQQGAGPAPLQPDDL